MNKFEKQLEKWNNGVLRGAQAKLAKKLGVSTATTALWATGKRRPSKGYAAQIATLFNMDIYNVFKLFEPHSTVYHIPSSEMQHCLREKDFDSSYYGTDNTTNYSPAQSNSVQVPFFNAIPKDFPQYNEDEVLEWWSIPRRYALGTKYIIPSVKAGFQGVSETEDLCFIKPCSETSIGNTVLYLLENGKYVYGKITQQNTIEGLSEQQKKQIKKTVGIIVRRISTPE
ncbi:MAG: helix-turn-helix transcriptional regulator [Elusimicrobiaceae bacterium]|nr:helix-turn-helix transcriptional regulator [Elusimicrobiaceae bacterium]